MSIMTIETTITRKYLFGKSKSDLAYMYLELLERAVQAEAERDAARAAMLDENRKYVEVLTDTNELRLRLERVTEGATEWRKRAEQAEAERDALVLEREELLSHIEYLVREGQQAEADARALAKILHEQQRFDLTDEQQKLTAKYLEAAK